MLDIKASYSAVYNNTFNSLSEFKEGDVSSTRLHFYPTFLSI